MRTFYVPATEHDRLEQTQYAMTLEEIGNVLGVTRERIRQIEKAALDKLRRMHMRELLEMRAMAIEMRKRSGNSAHRVIR